MNYKSKFSECQTLGIKYKSFLTKKGPWCILFRCSLCNKFFSYKTVDNCKHKVTKKTAPFSTLFKCPHCLKKFKEE